MLNEFKVYSINLSQRIKLSIRHKARKYQAMFFFFIGGTSGCSFGDCFKGLISLEVTELLLKIHSFFFLKLSYL